MRLHTSYRGVLWRNLVRTYVWVPPSNFWVSLISNSRVFCLLSRNWPRITKTLWTFRLSNDSFPFKNVLRIPLSVLHKNFPRSSFTHWGCFCRFRLGGTVSQIRVVLPRILRYRFLKYILSGTPTQWFSSKIRRTSISWKCQHLLAVGSFQIYAHHSIVQRTRPVYTSQHLWFIDYFWILQLRSFASSRVVLSLSSLFWLAFTRVEVA